MPTSGPSRPTPLLPFAHASSSSLAGPSSAPASIPSFPLSPAAEHPTHTHGHKHDHDHDDDDECHDDDSHSVVDVIPTRAGRKLCVRHKQMADQGVNAKLQKSLDKLPTSERSAITQFWATFSNAPHAKRKIILEGILTMCCFSQLSHLSDSLNLLIRIDPFSLLPRETNLRILGYLDAFSLGRAAQVSKSWKALADDDLLWRRMCGQHIDRKCEKCGWGLPALERRRLKVELKGGSPSVAVGVGEHHSHDEETTGRGGGGEGHGLREVVTRNEALKGMMTGGLGGRVTCDLAAPSPPPTPPPSTSTLGTKRLASAMVVAPSSKDAKRARIESSDEESDVIELAQRAKGLTREVRLTRPWKTVYCERLVVERNWRKGRFQSRTLKGHTDGVMCLQYHLALSNPSYPVLITGSYDRTVRIWNLDTGAEVRCLRGHTRAVRALQFDQMLLFTGAMDGTVRMWNWRAGECLRVLEGHTDGVVSLNYNGYLLATGSADSTIQVWNFRSGGKFTLRGHDEWVNSVVIWDGKTTPGDTDPTQMPSFCANSLKRRDSAAIDANKDKPEIDPGTVLFSGGDDGTVRMWDLVTQECVRTFEGHKAQVQSLRVVMVDMSEEEVLQQERRERRSITPPDHLASAGQVPVGLPHDLPGHMDQVLDNTPDDFDPGVHRGRPVRTYIEPKAYVHAEELDRLPQQRTSTSRERERERKKALLVSGSLDGTVKVWDVEEGKERCTMFGHIEGVWGVDVDALRLVSASHDRTIKVWDRETGQCVQTLVGHRGAVTSLQLSDDMIVSGSDDGDVMTWSFAPQSAVAS